MRADVTIQQGKITVDKLWLDDYTYITFIAGTPTNIVWRNALNAHQLTRWDVKEKLAEMGFGNFHVSKKVVMEKGEEPNGAWFSSLVPLP